MDIYAAGLIMHELMTGKYIIPPGSSAATTLALLHTHRGPLPKRLVAQASRATNIPTLSNKSILPCLCRPAQIDFEAMGISTMGINTLRLSTLQSQISAMQADLSWSLFIMLTDQLLDYEATKRPSATVALQHPYFSLRFAQPPPLRQY